MAGDYAKEILAGSPKAVARLISWLENEDERAVGEMEKLYPHTGKAHVVGITGSPGAGKSTLTDKLTQAIRREELTVGIIAIDPSSPFTGGAVLGDRVRMSRLSTDPGVYIRSMATRGFLGGLSKATGEVVKVLDAFGRDIVIIETVGVGQDEVDIVRIADTTCLVLVPGQGDAIQSMKAGVMEIADIFVINKADYHGADQLWTELHWRLEQDAQIRERKWIPPIIKTIAVEEKGIEELWHAICEHRSFLEQSGELMERRKERTRLETLRMIHNYLFKLILSRLTETGEIDRLVNDILNLKTDPYATTRKIVNDWLRLPEEIKGKEAL